MTRPTAIALATPIALICLTLLLYASAHAETTRTCHVTWVHDGDTVHLSCNGVDYKTRLYCIDAPELAQRPWGLKARRNLRRIAKGDVEETITSSYFYGGDVARLVRPDLGIDVGLEQVKMGFAAVYPDYCDDQTYIDAEAQAKAGHIGIWSEPGLQQAPWDWRHRPR